MRSAGQDVVPQCYGLCLNACPKPGTLTDGAFLEVDLECDTGLIHGVVLGSRAPD